MALKITAAPPASTVLVACSHAADNGDTYRVPPPGRAIKRSKNTFDGSCASIFGPACRQQNRLSYLPETIGLASGLRKLNLRGNALRNLPNGFCLLYALEALDVAQNNLVRNSSARDASFAFRVLRRNRVEDQTSPNLASCVKFMVVGTTISPLHGVRYFRRPFLQQLAGGRSSGGWIWRTTSSKKFHKRCRMPHGVSRRSKTSGRANNAILKSAIVIICVVSTSP